MKGGDRFELAKTVAMSYWHCTCGQGCWLGVEMPVQTQGCCPTSTGLPAMWRGQPAPGRGHSPRQADAVPVHLPPCARDQQRCAAHLCAGRVPVPASAAKLLQIPVRSGVRTLLVADRVAVRTRFPNLDPICAGKTRPNQKTTKTATRCSIAQRCSWRGGPQLREMSLMWRRASARERLRARSRRKPPSWRGFCSPYPRSCPRCPAHSSPGSLIDARPRRRPACRGRREGSLRASPGPSPPGDGLGAIT